jgi:PHS family inorganic phosphate transporter-like MFS transporter
MCDAYDLFVINLVIVILKILYPEDAPSSHAISTAALWGAIAGQILFGFLADKIGRKKGLERLFNCFLIDFIDLSLRYH